MTTAITKYGLKLVTSLKPHQQVSKAVTSNCFKSFFVNRDNRLAKFVGKSQGLDKTFKLGKAVSECVTGILQETGGSAEAIKAAQNTSTLTKTARDVIALGNVLNGAIPSCVASSRKCVSLLRQCFASNPSYRLPSSENFVLPKDLLLCKSDMALAAAREACTAIGCFTFATTFGGLRTTLLANKVAPRPFLSSEAKEGLGLGVTLLMTANHAAGVVGGALSIVAERRAYLRGMSLLTKSPQENAGEQCSSSDLEAASLALKRNYIGNLKKCLLTIIEKGLELIADCLKLIPFPMSAACNLACVGALTAGSSMLGIYKIWQSTGSSK